MTRKEHLRYCKICKHKKFDPKQGLLCGLTNSYANFENECPEISLIEGEILPSAQVIKAIPPKKPKQKVFNKLGKREYFLVVVSALVTSAILRLLAYSFELSESPITPVIIFAIYLLVAAISFTQHRNKQNTTFLFSKFQFGFLLALLATIINYLYITLVEYNTPINFIGLLLLLLILNFFAFLLSKIFALFIDRIINIKQMFVAMLPAIVLIACLGIIQSTILIPNESVIWNEKKAVNFGHFKGIPNFLSGYSGVISSGADYDIIAPDSLKLFAFSRSDYSWIKKPHRSEYILNHERYHFNISELIARMTRQKIAGSNIHYFSNQALSLYRYFINDRLELYQDKYDKDTQHGINYEAQMDWQFLVDSLLLEYAYYKSPYLVLNKTSSEANYYRKIHLNSFFKIEPTYPVPDSLAEFLDCYKFDRDKTGRTIRITHLNKGTIVADESRGLQILKMSYKEPFEYWANLNSSGKAIRDNRNVSSYKIYRNNEADTLVVYYFDENGKLTANHEDIVVTGFHLNQEGKKELARYYNAKLKPIEDKTGFINVKYEYVNNGKRIIISNFNSKGQLQETKHGIASINYLYDNWKNLRQIELYDAEDELTDENPSGHAKYKYIFDEFGYVCCEAQYDRRGALIPFEKEIAFSIYKFNQFGYILESADFGVNRNIKIDEEGYGRFQWEYDSLNRMVKLKNYDAYHQWSKVNRGFAQREFQYDTVNPDSYTIRDYIPDPENIDRLILSTVRKFNYKDGLLVECKFMNDSLQISPNPDGISIIRYEHDEEGRLIKLTNLTASNVLVQDKKGIAIEEYSYDKANNCNEKRYYQSINKLLDNDSLPAIEKYAFENNQIVEERYYNAQMLPIPNQEGYSFCRHTYNGNSYPCLIEYLDPSGKRAPLYNNIAAISQEFDSEGNLITQTNLDALLKPQVDSTCVARTLFTYDKYNRQVSQEYFDEHLNPVLNSEGYAKLTYHYDLHDNIIVQQLFDTSGQAVEDTSGIGIFWRSYNRNNEIIDYKTYAADYTDLAHLKTSGYTASTASIPETLINFEPYIASDYHFTNYETNTITGKEKRLTTWHNKKQKESEGYYVDGKLEGNYITWYKSGQMQSKVEYKNGKMDGSYISYHENGKIESMRFYRNNNLIIEDQTTWYEDGQLRSEYVDGEYVEYNEAGKRII